MGRVAWVVMVLLTVFAARLGWADVAVSPPSLDDPGRETDPAMLAGRLRLDGRVILRQLAFQAGRAEFRPEALPILEAIRRLLVADPQLRVRIEVHTDGLGATEWNLKLSSDRAQLIQVWLAEHGVDAARLDTLGVGKSRPVATNTTAVGRQTNRRVELVRLNH